MNITGFLVMETHGDQIPSDAQGSDIAFCCVKCDHPVLASTLENHPGSDEQHLSVCRGCGCGFYLDVRLKAEKLYIHDVEKRS